MWCCILGPRTPTPLGDTKHVGNERVDTALFFLVRAPACLAQHGIMIERVAGTERFRQWAHPMVAVAFVMARGEIVETLM
jgi:hypothetical protein